MKRLAAAILMMCACNPPPKTAPPPKPAPRLDGDALVYRFVDHAAAARLEGADLPAAWEKLEWPAKLPSPYSGLRGDDALRVVELALTDADVAEFGKPHANDPNNNSVRFDPVWNRTRAVYQSKTSLFAPAPARWSFDVPKATHLRGSMAAAPGSPPVELVIELDGHERLRRKLDSAGTWLDFELLVDGAHTVSLVTRGPPGAAAFWGDPLLLDKGAGAPGPNLLLVIIDTLRADAMPAMPRLQALAAGGARFDQAITAATWTRPSLLALLGGDYPTALGQSAEQMIPPDAERRRFYAVSPPLLPRILEQRGWQADAIGNNFFLLGYPQIGLSLGFETIADVRHPVLDTPAIERAAEAYFAAHQRESWYLQVHFDGPHWPYTPPPEYLKRVQVPPEFPADPMARAYLAEALYADDHLGMLVDALKRLKLDERTVIVVVGDHGEVFDHAHDHVVEALDQPTLHHHGWSAYDEILRVPLVIARPKLVPAVRVAQQVSFVDVQATILDLLGLPFAKERSLAGLWSGRPQPERAAFTEGQNVRALRWRGWLYLLRGDGRLRLPDGKRVRVDEELYDLARDPEQHHNLAGAEPAQRELMRAEMARLAPAPAESPAGVAHLRLAPADRPHLVEGLLRSDGAISVRGVRNGEATPVDAHVMRVQLRGDGQLDLSLEPSDARLSFELSRDGIPLRASDLLVGPYGLPMLDGNFIEAQTWSWLDAARPPVDGNGGELLMWRDPSHAMEGPALAAHANDEVAGMMRRWGYAQPGK